MGLTAFGAEEGGGGGGHDAGMRRPNERLRIGVIGLGAMGRPMAGHLLRAHDGVAITSRHPARDADLVDAGAEWYDSPRALAAEVDLVLLMLPDLPEVEQVLSGDAGILAAQPTDLLLVVSSTSSPTGMRDLAVRLDRDTHGSVRVVDAPVSGGVEGAAAGGLSIMVGGAGDDAALACDVLRACGTPVHLGPLGAGQVAKACNQLVVAATVLALGEAAVLAERSGLDVAALFELLQGGYADSRILRTKGALMVAQDYDPRARACYVAKDVRFAADVAAATHTGAVLTPAVLAAFDELVESGLGDLDMAVTRRFVDEHDQP